MNTVLNFDFTVNKENKTVIVEKEFDAPLEDLWAAWTEPELLDLWWGPLPWKSKTKAMDFRVGGKRLYAMVGPKGEEHWAFADYTSISPKTNFKYLDGFCDREGNLNADFPRSDWDINFSQNGHLSKVHIVIRHEQLSDLEMIIKMGFKEGFTIGLNQLEEYMKAKFKLRKELKINTNPRVCTYLNFPGNTEEAFTFYRSIFGTEFSGKGIQRFGDLPADENQPPMDEKVKKMVLHIELPILGGHVLMATDSPQEMGLSLTRGNNMHISLEPNSRAETKRLFDALSKGGDITMPLEDMFFGAYYGTCTDKYGINWMLNFISAEA